MSQTDPSVTDPEHAATLVVAPPSGENSAALDQWRGFALLLVLVSHGFYFTNRVHGFGRVGVNLFFFISGILVFRSLAKSRLSDWWGTARSFWKRRVRRLYPALLAYIVAMIPATMVLQRFAEPGLGLDIGTFLRGVPFAIAYIMNYSHMQVMGLGHLWSLSCEMQFYLLAPLIFLAGGRGLISRRLVWGLLLCALVGFGYSRMRLAEAGLEKYHFEFAVWPMMLGFCCEYEKAWLRRVPGWLVLPVSACALILFLAGTVSMLAGHEMKKLLIAGGAFVMIPCLYSYLNGYPVPGVPGRILAWVGERTYSIYLWQQPLTICNYLPATWHPLGALVSVLVGAVSFHFVEKPFLSSARSK